MTTPARLADLIETANEDEIAILEKALRQVRSAKANLGATWGSAVEEFLVKKDATTEASTSRYYQTQLTVLVRWCEEQGVTLHQFRESHLDKYIVWRKSSGGRSGKAVSPGTVYHDQIATCAFFKFASMRGLVGRNPLAGYKVEKPPKVSIPVPTQAELTAVLQAIEERYDPRHNEDVRYMTPAQRRFFRTRDYALVAGLINTGVRSGEFFALTLKDINLDAREIRITKSKTKRPRTVPISAEWATILDAWLKVRTETRARNRPGIFLQRRRQTDNIVLRQAFQEVFGVCRDQEVYAARLAPLDRNPHRQA